VCRYTALAGLEAERAAVAAQREEMAQARQAPPAVLACEQPSPGLQWQEWIRHLALRRCAMTAAEISAGSRLGGYALAGLVSRIEQVPWAIAGRAFAPIGRASAPTRVIHDSITRGVYLAVRRAGTAAG
jgi:hypothetical protein